jgi:hypothetical protein
MATDEQREGTRTRAQGAHGHRDHPHDDAYWEAADEVDEALDLPEADREAQPDTDVPFNQAGGPLP